MGDICMSVLWHQLHGMEYTSEHAIALFSKLTAELHATDLSAKLQILLLQLPQKKLLLISVY